MLRAVFAENPEIFQCISRQRWWVMQPQKQWPIPFLGTSKTVNCSMDRILASLAAKSPVLNGAESPQLPCANHFKYFRPLQWRDKQLGGWIPKELETLRLFYPPFLTNKFGTWIFGPLQEGKDPIGYPIIFAGSNGNRDLLPGGKVFHLGGLVEDATFSDESHGIFRPLRSQNTGSPRWATKRSPTFHWILVDCLGILYIASL